MRVLRHPDQRALLRELDGGLERHGAGRPSEDMGVRGDVEAGRRGADVPPAVQHRSQHPHEHVGLVAVTDREREVVDLCGERNGDDRPLCGLHAIGEVGVESIGEPCHTFGCQELGCVQAGRRAGADPALCPHAACLLDHGDAALEIGRFLFARLIGRDDVLRPGVSCDHVTLLDDVAHQAGMAFGDDAADVEHRVGVRVRQHLEQAERADLGAIFRPRLRLGVVDAGAQRIAHRPDAGRGVVGPPLQHDAHGERDRPAVRPAAWQMGKFHRYSLGFHAIHLFQTLVLYKHLT